MFIVRERCLDVTAENFCYWLQGYFEMEGLSDKQASLSGKQIECIQRHLNMVFAHDIDPKAGSPEHQAVLSDIHDGQCITNYLNNKNTGPVKIRC